MTYLTEQIRAARQALPAKTLSTRRACTMDQIRQALRLAATAKRRVRVYSPAGFVPNSYRAKCLIQYVEVTKGSDGRLFLTTGWTSAQRSGANGSLQVVQ